MNIWTLPKLYPDELVYSGIARYLQSWGYSSARQLLRNNQLNSSRKINIDWSSDWMPQAIALGLASCKTPKQIAQDHTLLPYYVCFESRLLRQAICRYISKGGEQDKTAQNYSRTPPNFMMPTHLRFCFNCLKADIESSGESYWRRSHQLPGCVYCSTHQTRLFRSLVPRRPKGPIDYLAAHPKRCIAINKFLEPLIISKIFSLNLGVRSCALLQKPLGRPSNISLPAYRSIIRNAGYEGKGEKISACTLDDDFKFFLGTSLMAQFSNEPQLWWHGIFWNLSHKVSPVGHLLFRMFLESRINGRTFVTNFY